MFEKEAQRSFDELDDRGVGDDWSIEESYVNGFTNGAEFGYNLAKEEIDYLNKHWRSEEERKANEWHYVTDKLPPNPKESEDGISIIPLNYICAYDCGGIDYECDEFMYLGNGEWNGENKDYPIYAWLDCPVNVPKPRKE